jgi:hypothetical protein
MESSLGLRLQYLARQRSLQVALLLWVLLSAAGMLLGQGEPWVNTQVVVGSIALVVLTLEIGIVALLTRRRPILDLGQRAPERAVARQEIAALWLYGAIVLVAGRLIGLHFFGQGIAMHLTGSLVGDTRPGFRLQSPVELYTWAAYNGILLALIPYIAFRWRGYSNYALNLKSANLKNDTLVIFVVLAICIALDLTGSNIFQLTPHQQLVGGALSFILHLFGTDLPVMIFIYAILVPRYAKLVSPVTAYLLGAASYPAMHIFESWTQYDSIPHALLSVIMVFLTFFPPGLVKSFLTMRTGNAWVHVWAFHAISPHVTVDTRLIVNDLHIQ